ncbi:MAG: hypothetical protein LKI24_02620 [Acidipropionibacterium sp.]|jgi:transposase-like protein|nr:hypothetical protein [Acidipropionibacterium sp.]
MTTSNPTPADQGSPATEPAGPRTDRPTRRKFTAEYKRRMVDEYHQLNHGDISAFLRRERLYHSNIREWEAKINAGTLDTPAPKGRPRRTRDEKRIAVLEQQVARLEADVKTRDDTIADRDAALDVLGKGFAFLEAVSSKNASFPQTTTAPGRKTPSATSRH